MRLSSLIKRRASVRDYRKRAVSRKVVNKILESGIWGPSLGGEQVAFFTVIRNKKIKHAIILLLEKNLKKLGILGRVVFVPSTMKALKSCDTLIAIYNNGRFRNLVGHFAKYVAKNQNDNIYLRQAEQAEMCCISASIQNMILRIEDLGLGSCWLHTPLFCESEIKKVLKIDMKLVAFLAVGYPKTREKRSRRISKKQFIIL